MGAEKLSLTEKQIDSIKNSAGELFAAKGYNDTSVTDIVNHANIARGTFYNYFPTKLELFEEIIKDVLKKLDESIWPIELGKGEVPILKQLRNNFSRLFRVLEKNPIVIHYYSNYSPTLENELHNKLKEFDTELVSLVSSSLKMGMTMGIVRRCNPRNASLLLIGGLTKFFVHHSIDNSGYTNVEELIDEILDFYIKGLMY